MKSELTTSIPVRFFKPDGVLVKDMAEKSGLSEALIYRVAASIALPLLASGQVNIFELIAGSDARRRVLSGLVNSGQLIRPVAEINAQTSLSAAEADSEARLSPCAAD